MKKIPFQNRIFAFIFSILFIFSLFFSFFTLPVELELFNPQSYYTMLEKEEYSEVIPDILSETLVYQTGSRSSQMNLVANKDTVKAILRDYLPAELMQTTFNKVVDQLLAYLNFKIPSGNMTVDISEIKASLASSSPEIAADYLATFPNCRAGDVAGINLNGDLNVEDLPACKPGGIDLSRFEEVWTNAFEDVFNSLPSSISLVDVLPLQQTISNKFFNNYSLVRWGFRLLPIVSILLLTLIAVLLRNQREVMWKWCGRLLVIVSGLTLVGLVVLMIGFDQFVAMLLNPVLQNLISGFGFILLGVVQDVGFQVLVWVVISALVVMGFGLLLMLAVKFIRPRKEKPAEEEEQDMLSSADAAGELSEPGEKEFQPETLEEVEEREKEIKNEEDDTADEK